MKPHTKARTAVKLPSKARAMPETMIPEMADCLAFALSPAAPSLVMYTKRKMIQVIVPSAKTVSPTIFSVAIVCASDSVVGVSPRMDGELGELPASKAPFGTSLLGSRVNPAVSIYFCLPSLCYTPARKFQKNPMMIDAPPNSAVAMPVVRMPVIALRLAESLSPEAPSFVN